MKLLGNLKKQVENADSREEAREIIKSAGMMLTDDELLMVSGGTDGGGADDYGEDEIKVLELFINSVK